MLSSVEIAAVVNIVLKYIFRVNGAIHDGVERRVRVGQLLNLSLRCSVPHRTSQPQSKDDELSNGFVALQLSGTERNGGEHARIQDLRDVRAQARSTGPGKTELDYFRTL